MRFAEIPGLDQQKKHLISTYKKGKVAHAQLFFGTDGIACMPMAMAYASYLMCENKSEDDACGICSNCIRIQKLVHPDAHWFFPKISASDSGKYEKVIAEALPQWRLFVDETPYGNLNDWATKYGQENKNLQISRQDSRQVLKNVSMRSVEGGYKIIFIWGVEYMHPSAANALLKALEEPTEKTIYLLISFDYDSILRTVISRIQLVNIPPNQDAEIQQYLKEKMDTDPAKAAQLAKMAQGKIGTAIRQLQIYENIAYNEFRDWMLACWNSNFTSLVNASEDFSKAGKTNQRSFLMFSLTLIRNAVLKSAGVETTIVNPGEDQFIQKYAERLGLGKLEEMYALLNTAIQHLERNSNPRITYLNLSLAITGKLNGQVEEKYYRKDR